jgi:hypothetical protein
LNEGRGRGVVRLASEFLVIVVGVLTALGVDQLMEGRRERVLERELLASLIEDLRLDSADFTVLPEGASRRAWGAEVLLREFDPGGVRGIRVEGELADLGPFPSEMSDEALVRAFAAVGGPTDLDVASGAYSEFSSAGGQRLVRNQDLRRAIHTYYASVQSNLKFDPRVQEGMRDLERGALELGLHPGDGQAVVLRERLSLADAPFFAGLRRVQQDAIVQSDIADLLLIQAVDLMGMLRDELGK